MTDTITALYLDYPIVENGVEVGSLDVRRPILADILATEKYKGTEADKEVYLFANLAGVSPDTIKRLDMADYRAYQELYTGFLSSRSGRSDGPA